MDVFSGDGDSGGGISAAAAVNTATAAVRLVGAVLNTAGPSVKNAFSSSGPQDADVTGVSTRAVPAGAAVGHPISPDRETRAYETVNYVLRTMGSRILDAGLVNTQALAHALTAAMSHIEMRLFSVETNRLFQSLASKLNDATLVNSVFTCIYFLGFLLQEIKSSLPGYTSQYIPLGQRIIQQIFKVAIGEEAFQENLNANLEAYKTLASTAGLLRPTDLDYSIFPGTRYPSLLRVFLTVFQTSPPFPRIATRVPTSLLAIAITIEVSSIDSCGTSRRTDSPSPCKAAMLVPSATGDSCPATRTPGSTNSRMQTSSLARTSAECSTG